MVTAPNRPFATDLFTGLMLPDGIFVTMLGRQHINVQLENLGPAVVTGAQVYLESVSNPGISVTPGTRTISNMKSGAARVERWEADFSSCPAGKHYVSFIVEDGSGTKTRLIKKIFVTRVTFDTATRTFRAETPEGILAAQFLDLVVPRIGCDDGTHQGGDCCCCCGHERTLLHLREDATDDQRTRASGTATVSRIMNDISKVAQTLGPAFRFCPPGYLLRRTHVTWTPTPTYSGQYSDLPFEDPWWKILLCILALLLLIASAIAEAVDGSGSVTVGTGTDDTGSPVCDSCGVRAGGGGTSYVAAGLLAAAAAAATAAGLSDTRDPIRRGQDATPPAAGETTLKEVLDFELSYPEAVALGRSFSVQADWEYQRITDSAVYTASASDTTANVHVLSSYEIDAPEVYRRYKQEEDWIITGKFFDADGHPFKGTQIFVQCFLVGPAGEWRRFVLQDDGIYPDADPGNGVYSGRYRFSRIDSEGLWRYYVIAQDVNHAQPDMKPEEAAQIIGGMVLTHQLVITFDTDDCPFVPDGHVMVV